MSLLVDGILIIVKKESEEPKIPNWCYNIVELENSDKSKIDALEQELQKVNEEGRSLAEPFNHLRPRPEDQEDNWYDWNCIHWGTKWDANNIEWERLDDNMIRLYVETAWSPPVALYEYLTEQGWKVEALYHEPGMQFAGNYSSDFGEEYGEYDIADLESIEALPEDVIEFAGLREEHENWIEENGDKEEVDCDEEEVD